ncbi:hypothetical protein Pla110_15610 [Polystyrenella longa]|uniref:Uncharacterized protein n=1 Tax=Polystyrenella longa TaxID=2528007 RepID=A0A518CKU0_9PLAN|nr:hypothetical protein [Polystyrenella longa]QDU79842.1 hypothetical protein Pla110_15610 [Polystyrenella longa]
MGEQKGNLIKSIFVRYKLLFIVYGVGLLFATWEYYGVPDESHEMMQQEDYLKHLLQHVDEDDSFYGFQIKKFEGRPESEYLKGMREFRRYELAMRKVKSLKDKGKGKEATAIAKGARSHLEEARRHFEIPLQAGVISNENLMVFHCITLKLLNAPEEEYQVAIVRLQKNFPLMELPPFLREQ